MLTFIKQQTSTFILLFLTFNIQAQVISIYAGKGFGEGKLANKTSVMPSTIVFNKKNDLIYFDQFTSRIMKIDTATHRLSWVAGNTISKGDTNLAVNKVFRISQVKLALDKQDNIYATDLARVWKINPVNGSITCVAGNGLVGSSGNGGLAVNAKLSGYIGGIALDTANNLYISDKTNNMIRRVDANTGIINVVAGLVDGIHAAANDGDSALYATVSNPTDMVIDTAMNLYFISGSMVRTIDLKSTIINKYAGNGISNQYFGDGDTAWKAAISQPNGLALDKKGNLYISDYQFGRVRRVNRATKIITTFVGGDSIYSLFDSVNARFAQMPQVGPIAFDPRGNLYVSDLYMRIRRIDTSTKKLTLYAGNIHDNYDEGEHDAYTTRMHMMTSPLMAPNGSMYFSDAYNYVIRAISPSGIIRTIAGNGSSYLTGTPPANPNFVGDTTSAKKTSLNSVTSFDYDRFGNMFLVDGQQLRRIDARTDSIQVFSGYKRFVYLGDGDSAYKAAYVRLQGVVIDKVRNWAYLSDVDNHRIRKIDLNTQLVSTVAGDGRAENTGDLDSAYKASIISPYAMVLDDSGNVYFTSGHRIRKITLATGIINTIIGGYQSGGPADGDSAKNALLNNPMYLTIDHSGNLFINDTWNYRVYKIDAVTTKVKTVLGNGTNNANFKEGDLATNASLGNVGSIFVDHGGNFYFFTSTIMYRINHAPVSISNPLNDVSRTICYGHSADTIKAFPASGGNGIFRYLWIQSVTGPNGPFQLAEGGYAGSQYVLGQITQTTWYRRIAFTDGVGDTSVFVKIDVNKATSSWLYGKNQVRTTRLDTFGVSAAAGSVYHWWVEGGTLIKGQGSNQIQVKWQDSAGFGKVYVQAQNANGCFGDTLMRAVQILQSPPEILMLTRDTLISVAQGQEINLGIVSNVDWKCIYKPTWVTVTPDFGADNGTMQVKFQATQGIDRKDSLVFVGGHLTRRCILIQNPMDSIALDQDTIYLQSSGEQKTLQLSSNTNWNLSTLPTWCSVSPQSGTGNTQLAVYAGVNNQSMRSFTLNATAGTANDHCVIIQFTNTAVNEPNEEATFTIAPNPANEFLLFTNNEYEIVKLRLIDIHGQTVLSTLAPVEANSTSIINVGEMQAGIYFLRVEGQGKIMYRKVVVMSK